MKKIVLTVVAVVAVLAVAKWSTADNRSRDGSSDATFEAPVKILVNPDAVLRDSFPSSLFSFNVNHYAFEKDFLAEDGSIPAKVTDNLTVFEHSMYRYPGGLVANRFHWESATGPSPREPQKKVAHESATPVRFGVNEYFEFVAAVGGRPWYVLNLVGWHDTDMIHELSAEEVAASNARLAALRVENAVDAAPRYYQLGNELDRAEYQWSNEKYLERARKTMDAISAVDPEARFVAFLRDFDWVYKKDERKGTKSLYTDFIPAILKGLPEVNDFSLHFYYDDPDNSRKIKSIERRIAQFRRAIDVATQARGGKPANVWITEHARGVDLPRGRAMERADLTGNLSGAVSTADFLIAMSQMPEVQGAFLHGLNAGPWQVFDATVRDRDLRPRPVYWGMRILHDVSYEQTLATTTVQDEVFGDYLGGYDVRASGFSDKDRSELGLWVVNRAPQVVDAQLQYASLAGRSVRLQHQSMSLPEGEDIEARFLDPKLQLEPLQSCLEFSDAGIARLALPAGSVSAFRFVASAAGPCDAGG